MAAACPLRRGPPTPTGGVRHGRTRCSRTTRSSASACGWQVTSTSSWRDDAWTNCATRSVPISSTRSWRRRNCGSRSWPPSGSGWPSSRTDSIISIPQSPPTCSAWWTTSSGAAYGSWAVTAGRTTSAPAGSTTCWRRAATSTCWCSTPRSTRTPAARCPSRRRSARSPSSPPQARRCRRRTSPCRRSPTETSTSRRSPWARTPSRPCRLSARRRPTTGRRW